MLPSGGGAGGAGDGQRSEVAIDKGEAGAVKVLVREGQLALRIVATQRRAKGRERGRGGQGVPHDPEDTSALREVVGEFRVEGGGIESVVTVEGAGDDNDLNHLRGRGESLFEESTHVEGGIGFPGVPQGPGDRDGENAARESEHGTVHRPRRLEDDPVVGRLCRIGFPEDGGKERLVAESSFPEVSGDAGLVGGGDLRGDGELFSRRGESGRHFEIAQRPHDRPGTEFADVFRQKFARGLILPRDPSHRSLEDTDPASTAVGGALLPVEHDVDESGGGVTSVVGKSL